MDTLIEVFNDAVDGIAMAAAALLELPLSVLMLFVVAAFAVFVGLWAMVARWRKRPLPSRQRLKAVAAVLAAALFVLFLDHRFYQFITEFREFRADLRMSAGAAPAPPAAVAPAAAVAPRTETPVVAAYAGAGRPEPVKVEAGAVLPGTQGPAPDAPAAAPDAPAAAPDAPAAAPPAPGPRGPLVDGAALEAALQEVFPRVELRVEAQDRAVDYVMIRARRPVEAMIHVAVVDLTAPGLKIRITPELTEKWKTSEFARQTGCTVAINGEAGKSPARKSGFGQWIGNWIVEGHPVLLEDTEIRPFLSFDEHNRPTYFAEKVVDRTASPEKYNTIWGRWDLIVDGEVRQRSERRYPRTCMGVSQAGDRLYLLVADGKRPGHSLGLSSKDAGRVLLAMGAHDAMMCDQGGSACMYLKSRDGIASTPAYGRERIVYTHFGVSVDSP